MKKLVLLFVLCALTLRLSAQTETYSRVRIYTDRAGIARMAAAGLPVDHGEFRPGYCLTTELSASEILQVAQLGFEFDVLIPDLKAYYATQNQNNERSGNPQESTQAVSCVTAPTFVTPTNFTLGSMGGFFTLNEIYFHLDNMAQLYPNLIKPRVAIDSSNTTPEGRFVYYLKISDNPNVDETEPEMLYTAVHHAREPAGVSQLIMYMYYLLENYATNPEIQYLVNNTELYFIPCVNPDGYFYNETTDPNGGGMWRKNRKDNQDGTYGIDLNRNYGYNFGFDNQGSSPNTFADTYRGPSSFSEPETQQVKLLCEQHQFRIAINYHTYSNLLICPWGYQAQTFTPDAPTYNAWGALLTKDNKYAFGTPDQTVGYTANGSSDDWMYGEQNSKPKIMAMTPEAGDQADGFWPAQNRIIDICKLNLPMDLYAAHLLLAFATTKDTERRFLANVNGYLNYDVQRLGLDSPATYTVSIVPLSPWMTSVGAPRTYTSLSILQTVSDSISYTLNPATPIGTALPYIIQIGNGNYTWSDTVTKIYGVPTILFASNGSALTGWTSNTWNTTTSSFVSGPSSITDSPNGNYNSNANTRITMTSPVNLANVSAAQLSFYTRFELEPGYDFAQVQVSNDNGNTWNALCGKYTTNNNNLDQGFPTYTGVQSAWVKEEMSLDDYLGQSILVRFRLGADFGVQLDGFYFDDLLLEVLDTTTIGLTEITSGMPIGQNMPNPADGYTYIDCGRPAVSGTLEIIDAYGKLILAENIAEGTSSYLLNTATLAVGVYYYRCVFANGDVSEVRKMSVVR